MTEKIICPYCGHAIDSDTVELPELWQERGRIKETFKGIWQLVVEYMDAFRVAVGAPMSLRKKIRFLKPLAEIWITCIFDSKGKRYKVTREVLIDGMTKVCNVEKFGFENHNYLKVIIVKGAERVSAEGLTAMEEKRREEKRGLRAPVGVQNFEPLQDPCPDEGKEEFVRRIKEISGNIGRRMP